MTEVSLYNEEDIIILKISGHAEYSKGADIVCASCSTLSGTLATMVKNLPINATVKFEDGLTEIRLNRKGLSIYTMEVWDAINFTMLGFSLLEEQYPNNVIVLEGRESHLFR